VVLSLEVPLSRLAFALLGLLVPALSALLFHLLIEVSRATLALSVNFLIRLSVDGNM